MKNTIVDRRHQNILRPSAKSFTTQDLQQNLSEIQDGRTNKYESLLKIEKSLFYLQSYGGLPTENTNSYSISLKLETGKQCEIN